MPLLFMGQPIQTELVFEAANIIEHLKDDRKNVSFQEKIDTIQVFFVCELGFNAAIVEIIVTIVRQFLE